MDDLAAITSKLGDILGLTCEVRRYDEYAVITVLSPRQVPLASINYRCVYGEWVFHGTSSSLDRHLLEH